MTGIDVAIVGLFLICCLYLFTPTEADDRETRQVIEEQREADFYREDPDELPLDEEVEDGD